MDAARAKSDQNVTGFDPGRVDRAGEFDHTDGEPCDIEVPGFVDIRHLGALATDQGTSGDLAATCDPFDDLRGLGRIDATETEVVEKEERLRTLDDQVVDVHRDTVDPDGVENAAVRGELDLGADTVGAGDQNGIAIISFEERLVVIETEHAGEGSVLPHDPRVVGATECRLDEIDDRISGFDVDSGSGIGQSGLGPAPGDFCTFLALLGRLHGNNCRGFGEKGADRGKSLS